MSVAILAHPLGAIFVVLFIACALSIAASLIGDIVMHVRLWRSRRKP